MELERIKETVGWNSRINKEINKYFDHIEVCQACDFFRVVAKDGKIVEMCSRKHLDEVNLFCPDKQEINAVLRRMS